RDCSHVSDDDPVRVPIEDSLDLHSFHPRDVPSVVDEYLQAAHAHGFTEVRLIHGRGIGVQRRIVQSLLAGHPLVAGFADAPAERGGRGATIVRLIDTRVSRGP
ncbi:MAG TPA: Smr/MutS family protein, partial [Aestuariivirgaceae bacterium]|nr:Smr/MutS family protein [Aestuariivirgaceae bacterium]